MLYMCCGILSDMNRNYKTASVHILKVMWRHSRFVIIQRVLETRANSVKQSACETAVVHTLKKKLWPESVTSVQMSRKHHISSFRSPSFALSLPVALL